jgi:enoyl-[acyl-carrier protein] reductase I
MKKIFFDRSSDLTDEQRDCLTIRYCDVTVEEEVRDLFAGTGPVAGVVHSVAFANPTTCLGREFHTEATDDITQSYHISCVSLATVTRHAQAAMPAGGAVVALTFDSRHVYPYYNWMGVNKAALEALVRALARRHGKDLVRVNAVSAGPLHTKAASKIPGFGGLSQVWRESSPLPWDFRQDRLAVAHAAAFLLGPYAAKITGQVLAVDGGAAVMGGGLQEHERPAPAE